VTALLILLTIAGVRAVGPAVGLNLPTRSVVVVIGCVLEAVLAGLLIMLRWRRPPGAGTAPGAGKTGSLGAAGPSAGTGLGSSDLSGRLRRLLNGILVTGLILIPVGIAIGSIGKFKRTRPVPPILRRPRVGTHSVGPSHLSHTSISLGGIKYVLVAILILALIVVAVLIWRRSRIPVLPLGAGSEEAAGTPAELARAVDSGRQALRELDDARAAIIRCYLAMEHSLAQAGAARSAAETPDELLGRAVADGLVGGDPAGRLTRLFYEARFSTHPMPPSRRDEAERALTELAATLPAREAAETADEDQESAATATGQGSEVSGR
jgi:Domain of unknown function (DUF4129)